MAPFNQDSEFNMRALSLLNKVGIPLMDSLSIYTHLIQSKLGFVSYPSHSVNTLLDAWLEGGGNVRPTWKSLLSLIRQFHLDDLAQKVETYLSGATVKQHTENMGEGERVMAKEGETIWAFLSHNLYNAVSGGGDLESQLSSRDNFIYQLKQENAMLMKVNEKLKAENELLRSLVPVKEEDATDGR